MVANESVVSILKFFISSNNPVIIIIDDLKIISNVVRIDDIYFHLRASILPEINKLPYGINCLIPYGKDLFFFNSEVVKIEGDELSVVLPTNIIKKHHREYERYNVDGVLFTALNIVKNIDDKDFISRFPLSMKQIFSKGLENVSYEEVVEKILDILRDKFGNAIFIDEFSQLPWLKYCRYNRTGLVLPDITSKSFLEPTKFYGFANLGAFLEPYRRNLVDNEVKVFVNYHVGRGFKSYIYVPLFVVDTLIGYIMVESNDSIDLNKFSDVSNLMRILGMADLIESFYCYNRFFVLNEHRDYPIPVIDISFGGVKIKIDKHISYFLNVGDTVKLYFRIGTRFFEFIGEVIRIGYENGSFVCAVKFLNMDKDSFYYIRRWSGTIERW